MFYAWLEPIYMPIQMSRCQSTEIEISFSSNIRRRERVEKNIIFKFGICIIWGIMLVQKGIKDSTGWRYEASIFFANDAEYLLLSQNQKAVKVGEFGLITHGSFLIFSIGLPIFSYLYGDFCYFNILELATIFVHTSISLVILMMPEYQLTIETYFPHIKHCS